MAHNIIATHAHIGQKTWHPESANYASGRRNLLYILNTHVSSLHIKRSLLFLRSLITQGENILFVCTDRKIAPLVEYAAVKTQHHYITSKWVGGTLTNWKHVQRTIGITGLFLDRFDTFLTEQNIVFPKYAKAKKRFEGLRSHRKLPAALFIINPEQTPAAVAEANALGIPVLACVNTGSSLKGVDYVIPVNTRSLSFFHAFFDMFVKLVK
jgi:small subunit ribosomal protein S2